MFFLLFLSTIHLISKDGNFRVLRHLLLLQHPPIIWLPTTVELTSTSLQNTISPSSQQLHQFSVNRVLQTECLCAPKLTYQSPNLQCDGIWRWSLWEVIRSCGALMNGSDLRRDTREMISLPYEDPARGQLSANQEEEPHLTLNLPAP